MNESFIFQARTIDGCTMLPFFWLQLHCSLRILFLSAHLFFS